MCGGPKIDTTGQDFSISEAGRSRAENDAREARVNEGLSQIKAIFEGGSYAAPAEMPKAFNATPDDGNYGNDKWGVTEVADRGDVKAYEGMGDFLAQRKQAMSDFYMPQIAQKADKAKEGLTFALARAGLLNSTVAGKRQAELGEQMALEKGSILSKIASDVANTKSRINQSRNAVESGLRASGDASSAASQALSSAVTFREEQPELSPLGNLFAGLADGIGSYNTGLEVGRIKRASTPNPLSGGSGRVVY